MVAPAPAATQKPNPMRSGTDGTDGTDGETDARRPLPPRRRPDRRPDRLPAATAAAAGRHHAARAYRHRAPRSADPPSQLHEAIAPTDTVNPKRFRLSLGRFYEAYYGYDRTVYSDPEAYNREFICVDNVYYYQCYEQCTTAADRALMCFDCCPTPMSPRC